MDYKNNIKSFQAEEFKTEEIKIIKNNVEYFPVRYIHAEYEYFEDKYPNHINEILKKLRLRNE
ncbi:hypothetical protein BBI00_06265 [Chryseobacterium arthrosphaerae]|uniref:Uncharacterized protein n=1 Tax=Chryseobacterium arthrosphaerae TaxID=651561 RepID=A0A1B8ZQV1_9FLAO|nr:hypothetical protein BBI00_06265 [Chryseobacterium arthrosphaerae]